MKKILLFLSFLFVSIGMCGADCSDKLIRNIDEYTNEITISTSMFIKPNITKIITTSGKSVYYLYVSLEDSYCTVDGVGLVVLFTDGTKISKPSLSVDCNYYGGEGYTYSSFIRLTQNEVILFSQKEIKGYKLYIFNESVSTENALEFKNMVECLINTK